MLMIYKLRYFAIDILGFFLLSESFNSRHLLI